MQHGLCLLSQSLEPYSPISSSIPRGHAGNLDAKFGPGSDSGSDHAQSAQIKIPEDSLGSKEEQESQQSSLKWRQKIQ